MQLHVIMSEVFEFESSSSLKPLRRRNEVSSVFQSIFCFQTLSDVLINKDLSKVNIVLL